MEQLPAESLKNVSEEELLELAKKELLRDVKCASVRAQQFGAHSWAKPQKFVPNKRFLRHMLVSASRDNQRNEEKLKHKKSSKITSAVSYQSHKYAHSSKRDKAQKIQQLHKRDSLTERYKAKKKQSRWDPSPEKSQLASYNKSSDKEKRHNHHPTKTKKKK